MSGGQQKRVNVALELLTKPSLLFLDEPTSGLDPGLDKSVMELMSGLAKDGRTVIIVTHSVANLGVCDRLLVLVPGGRVAFYGPPAEGLRYFGKTGLGRGLPGLRRRAGPGLGRGLQAVALLRRARGGRAGPAGPRGCPRVPGPAALTPRAAQAGLHPVPPLPGGHRLRPQLPGRAGHHAHRDRAAVAGRPVAGRPGRETGNQRRRRIPAAGPDHRGLLHRGGQLGPRAGQGTIYLRPGTGRRAVVRHLPVLQDHCARGHQRAPGAAAGRAGPDRAADARARLPAEVGAARWRSSSRSWCCRWPRWPWACWSPPS